ncbi:MAG: hypothetical protein IKZ46_18730 [Victivallales bacterium]|nr:hypothetical protein [Victivallales bacterium]
MMQTAPSARRFVTLRASANNVMRKLEVHGLSAWLASICSAVRHASRKRKQRHVEA